MKITLNAKSIFHLKTFSNRVPPETIGVSFLLDLYSKPKTGYNGTTSF